MTTTDFRTGHVLDDDHGFIAGPEHATRTDHSMPAEVHGTDVGAGTDPHHASRVSEPKDGARGGLDHPTGHHVADTHGPGAGGVHAPEPTSDFAQPISAPSARSKDTAAADTATPAKPRLAPKRVAPGVAGEQGQPAILQAPPRAAALADPTLALLADVLDDLERTRIANENRLRQLTRDETDSDGEERGFGLTLDHPDVARLASVVDGIAGLEHQATLNLARVMRAHPLGPWVKAQRGVGEKQAARLLAAIGDPYWNYLHARPRTVSELWAYCGLHVVAGGDQSGFDNHGRGVAARRKKGERANWSAAAKMRAWNIAGSMLKAGNRELYDKRKAATEGREHATPCVRCGPSGKPAQPGSPWSDAHRHADALRIVSKELLKQLWLAARDIHLGHGSDDTHVTVAEVEQT